MEWAGPKSAGSTREKRHELVGKPRHQLLNSTLCLLERLTFRMVFADIAGQFKQRALGLGNEERWIAIRKGRQTGIGWQTDIEQARRLQRVQHVLAYPVRHDIGAVSSQDDLIPEAHVEAHALPVQGRLAADMQASDVTAEVREDAVTCRCVTCEEIGPFGKTLQPAGVHQIGGLLGADAAVPEHLGIERLSTGDAFHEPLERFAGHV